MRHTDISDETLTFYYYNDGLSASVRQQVANAMAVDAKLAEQYRLLSQNLDRIAEVAPVTAPKDMTERWHETIRVAARQESASERRQSFHTWSFVLGAAVAVALVAGVGIGVFISGNQASVPVTTVATVNDRDTGNSAFVRGLQVHLRDSEAGLLTMTQDRSVERQELIGNIIRENRLFEKAAERNDAQNVARVLRAFELVLLQMAADDATPEDIDQLRAKLLFELNIMLTKISRDTSDQSRTI